MNKRLTRIVILKNDKDHVIAKPYYYELQIWDYVNGVQTFKSDREKFRFRRDEIFKEGDSLIFWAEDIPEKIEGDNTRFYFRFSTKKGDREEILTIEDDGNKTGFFEKSIVIDVVCNTLEEGTGEIIKINFLKIDNSVDVKIVGYENHSKEYIDKYVYPFDLKLWESDD